MHGYEMIQELEQRTGGAWVPERGLDLPTLQLLEEEGLIAGEEVEGKRRFTLTEAGTAAAAGREEAPRGRTSRAAATQSGRAAQALARAAQPLDRAGRSRPATTSSASGAASCSTRPGARSTACSPRRAEHVTRTVCALRTVCSRERTWDPPTPTSSTRCGPRSAATAARWPRVRPDDLAAHVVDARCSSARPTSTRRAIDDVVFGNANGAGEDNRNVARMAVLLAGLPTSVPGDDRQPAVRLEPRGGDAGAAARSRPATPSLVARRRRRVDEPRAVGAAQARARLPGAAHETLSLDHARLAHGQPADARAVDDLARRERREARRHATGSPARRQDEFALAQPPARGRRRGSAGFYDELGRARARAPSSSATRASAPTPRSRSSPSSSRRSRRTARSPPATPRRSTTAPARC